MCSVSGLRCSSVAHHVLSMCEILGSFPSTTHKQKCVQYPAWGKPYTGFKHMGWLGYHLRNWANKPREHLPKPYLPQPGWRQLWGSSPQVHVLTSIHLPACRGRQWTSMHEWSVVSHTSRAGAPSWAREAGSSCISCVQWAQGRWESEQVGFELQRLLKFGTLRGRKEGETTRHRGHRAQGSHRR